MGNYGIIGEVRYIFALKNPVASIIFILP